MKARRSTTRGKNNELRGLRVLVGRARHQASALSAGLRARGAEVLEVPFIEIRRPRSYKPLDAALHDLSGYDWLILTSVNGAEALFERLAKLKVDKQALRGLKIAAIGPSTRKAIQAGGLRVQVVPKEYVAESVVESLRNKVKGKRILLARARVARDVIPRELKKLGARVDVVEAYETILPPTSRKRLRAALTHLGQRPDVITFTSSSTVKNFVELLRTTLGRTVPIEGIHFASIGPITSATLRGFHLPVHLEARTFTIPGLIQAIVRFYRR